MTFSDFRQAVWFPTASFFFARFRSEQAMAEAAIQQYLAEHQVEALLKDVVLKLCTAKPDNVHAFIRDYMNDKLAEESNGNDAPPCVRLSAASRACTRTHTRTHARTHTHTLIHMHACSDHGC
jgi:hypothetical protein